MAEIIKIDEKTYRFEDEFVRAFLLIGENEALLVDAGVSMADAKTVAEGLTDLPLKHVITHADGDHTCGTGAFEEFYMHPEEEKQYYEKGATNKYIPLQDGMVIELGNRSIEIIHVPGHTYGSVALLDVNNRVLFSGDTIQKDSVFMFGPTRCLEEYVKSLAKLEKVKDRFDIIYPSHGEVPVKPDFISTMREAAELVYHRRDLAGTPERVDMFGNATDLYHIGEVSFFLPAE